MKYPSRPTKKKMLFRATLVLLFLAVGIVDRASAAIVSAPDLRQNLQQTDDNTHTIRPGETLNKIADAYDVSASDLMRLNSISDSDAIYVGQTLQLPDLSGNREASDEEASTEELTEEPADQEDEPFLPDITHTVQRGETLSEIAKSYGVSTGELMQRNGIVDADTVYAGQALRLPPEAVVPEESEPEIASDADASDANSIDAETSEPEPTAAPPVVEEPVVEEPVAEEPELNDEDSADAITEEGANEQESSAEENTGISIELLADAPTGLTTSLNRVYTVHAGDTIIRIALRAGVDLEALRQLNGLTAENDDRISVGQPLILPATAGELFVERADDESSTGEIYEVQSGDSIGAIAQEYDISMAALLAANRIIDPNAIYVGQSLVIPSPLEAEGIDATKVTVGAGRNGFYYYTVGPGDTLGKIATQFDTTPQALVAYNGLPNLETAFLGLELRIPFGPPTQPIDRPRIPQSGTSFMVSLSRQECWVYRGNKVHQQWTCSTGYGEWTTRKGTFAIKTKQELAKSSAHRLDMPYWLGIYDVGNFENGIHGLPTRWSDGQKIWTGLIGQPATFGCAMLTDDDAGELFALSFLGMPVHVID